MQTLETIKSKGQAGIKQLVTLGKAQSESVKTWGVTAGAAVAGGVALRVGAPGLVAILRTLTPLPVSLTVGAIGGGVLGWLYLERQKTATLDAATTAGRTPASPWPVSAPSQTDSALVTTPHPSPTAELPMATDTDELVTPPTSEVADDAAAAEVTAEVAAATPVDEPAPESTPVVDAEPVSEPPTQPDNLADIVGIGPVFAAHLQTAGIYTFAQLAALHPEQLEEIMAPSRGAQMIDAADWLAQAGRLAGSTTE